MWFYWDNEFDFSGRQLVLRGTNGSGKSRALEMLLPFVFDADRRRMDATGSGKVRIEDLMRTGDESTNRLGYLWIELIRHTDDEQPEYLTVGALVKYSRATSNAKVWYFTTPERIGHGLRLQDDDRIPLSRDGLAAVIGAERITDSPQTHRKRVRTQVFQLSGDSGKERFAGLLQLLHTLRSPDVGNRIDEGKLPLILSDALPPLSDNALVAAGEQLDGLNETRDAQKRLEEAEQHVGTFVEELGNQMDSTIAGIKSSQSYRDIRNLDDREQRVIALANAADLALGQARAARQREWERVTDADARARAARASVASSPRSSSTTTAAESRPRGSCVDGPRLGRGPRVRKSGTSADPPSGPVRYVDTSAYGPTARVSAGHRPHSSRDARPVPLTSVRTC